MITGRRPFEHANPDAAVIQKILSGKRPDRPTVGFSDALWTLLTQTWLEEPESSDSPPRRPDITNIIEVLQDETENWNPTSRPLPIERKPSGMPFVSCNLPTRSSPAITVESSSGSYTFPDRLVGDSAGLFYHAFRERTCIYYHLQEAHSPMLPLTVRWPISTAS